MNLFNSLGSNYSLSDVWHSLIGYKASQSASALQEYLIKHYGGAARLTYKGREALQLAIKTLNLPPGSAVAVNGFTCFAVYKAIKVAGAEVYYLDIPATDLNFSADTLAKGLKSNPKIKAVIVQNSLGYPCDIEAIAQFCLKHQLVLIEDLAHSIGTVYSNGHEAGTVGDMVMLSFGRDKMIDAVTGGALIIRNPKFAGSVPAELPPAPLGPRLRDRLYPLLTAVIRASYPIGLGRLLHAVFKITRLLSRSVDGEFYSGHAMPAWNAAAAMTKLQNITANLEHRLKIAQIYAENLDDRFLMPNILKQNTQSSNLRFPILARRRPELIAWLSARGLYVADIWYDAPVAPPRLLSFTDYTHQCPSSEQISQQIINLPTHHLITPQLAKTISENINTWLKST